MAICPNIVVGWFKEDVSRSLVVILARLLEEVLSGAILPLRRCTLILCAVTLDSRLHWYVNRTKVMERIILAYLHVLEYSCHHLFARRLAKLFRLTPNPHPVSYRQIKQRAVNVDISGSRPTETSFYFYSLPPRETFIVS